MGRIVTVEPGVVVPTQEIFSPCSFEDLFPYFMEERIEEMIPPALRELEGELALIDGHHRLMLAYLLGVELDVYVAEHPNDKMTPEEFGHFPKSDVRRTNNLIHLFFDYLPTRLRNVPGKCRTFEGLGKRWGIIDIPSLEWFIKFHVPEPPESFYSNIPTPASQ